MAENVGSIEASFDFNADSFAAGAKAVAAAGATMASAMDGAYDGAEKLQDQYATLAGDLAKARAELEALSKAYDESAQSKGRDAVETKALGAELTAAQKKYSELGGDIVTLTQKMQEQSKIAVDGGSAQQVAAQNLAKYAQALQQSGAASDSVKGKFQGLLQQYLAQTSEVNKLEAELSGLRQQWDALNASMGGTGQVEMGPTGQRVTQQLEDAKSKQLALKSALDKTSESMQKEAKAAGTAAEANTQLGKASKESAQSAKEQSDAHGKAALAYAAVAQASKAALDQITAAVQAGVNAYQESTAAQNMLAGSARQMGVSFDEAAEAGKRLSADGLLTETQATTSIANLLKYGMTIDQAVTAIERLKDSAVNSRQSHYDLGESVVVSTQGIRQELSTLADAAGVTENIGRMMQTYAKQNGLAADSLTAAQRAQAAYEGILRGTESTIGDAAKATEQYAGSQARYAAAAKETALAYGQAVVPALQAMQGAGAQFQAGATGLIRAFPELTAGATAFAATATGIITVTAGFTALKRVLDLISGGGGIMAIFGGPVGIAIGVVAAGIAAAAAAITVYNKQQAEARQQSAANVKNLSGEVGGLKALRDEYAALSSHTSLTETEKQRLLDIEKELVSQYGLTATGITGEGAAYSSSLGDLNEYIAAKERELGLARELENFYASKEFTAASVEHERLEEEVTSLETQLKNLQNLSQVYSAIIADMNNNPALDISVVTDAYELGDAYDAIFQNAISSIDGGREAVAAALGVVETDLNAALTNIILQSVTTGDYDLSEVLKQFVVNDSEIASIKQQIINTGKELESAGDTLKVSVAGIVDGLVLEAESKGQEVNSALVTFAQGIAESIADNTSLDAIQIKTSLSDILGEWFDDKALNDKMRSLEIQMKSFSDQIAAGIDPENARANLDLLEAVYELEFGSLIDTARTKIDEYLNAVGLEGVDINWDKLMPTAATMAPAVASLEHITDGLSAQAEQVRLLGQAQEAQKKITDAAAQQREYAQINQYVEAIKNGDTATKEYTDAVDALTKKYPNLNGRISENIESIDLQNQVMNNASANIIMTAQAASDAAMGGFAVLADRIKELSETGAISPAFEASLLSLIEQAERAAQLTVGPEYGKPGEFVDVETPAIREQIAALAEKKQMQQDSATAQAEYLAGLQAIEAQGAADELYLNDQITQAKLAGIQTLAAARQLDTLGQITATQQLLANDQMYLDTRMASEQTVHELQVQYAQEQITAMEGQRDAMSEYGELSQEVIDQQLDTLDSLLESFIDNADAVSILGEAMGELRDSSGIERISKAIDEQNKALSSGKINLAEYNTNMQKMVQTDAKTVTQKKLIEKTMADTNKQYKEGAKQTDAATKAQIKFNNILKDFGDAKKAAQAVGDLQEEINRLGKTKAALDKVAELKEKFGDAAEGTKAYKDAVKDAAEASGESSETISVGLEGIQAGVDDDISALVNLVNIINSVGSAGAGNPQVTAALQAILGPAGDAESALADVYAMAQALTGLSIDPATGQVSGLKAPGSVSGGGGGGGSGGGGGGGGGNKKLQKALDELQHKVTMDIIDPEQELAALEEISKKYAKKAKDKIDMDERVYEARKALYDEEVSQIERMRSLNLITDEEQHQLLQEALTNFQAKKQQEYDKEIARIEDLRKRRKISAKEEVKLRETAAEKLKAQADLEEQAEVEAYQRSQQLLQDAYDAERKLLDRRFDEGALSIEMYIAELERLRVAYAANAEVLEDIDDEMYAKQEEARNRAYQNELKQLDRRLQTGEMSNAEYFAAIQRMMESYAGDLNKQEELEEMIFQLNEERRKQDLADRYKYIDDLKEAGKITLQQELDMLYAIQRSGAKTDEERISVADSIRQQLLAIRQQEFDEELKLLSRRKEEDKITTEQLISNLELLRGKYADNLEMRKQLDEELYNAQRALYQERVDTVTSVAGAILDALKNQYTQQRDAEKASLKDSQALWKDWATEQKALTKEVYDARIKALEDDVNAQIQALEDIKQAEDRAALDEADRRKIAELELQLTHERDAENQYQLQKQLDAALKARDDRISKQELDDQKSDLKDYLTAQKEALQDERDLLLENVELTAEIAQKELDDKLTQLDAYWDDRLNTQKLRGEAEALLIENNQDKILDMLETYNPEYDAIGKSWGQKLVDGFTEEIADIAVQAKAQFVQVQQVMEDALRGYQATVSPTSAAALATNAAVNPVTNNYISVQGSTSMSEEQFQEVLMRINRELGLMNS